MSDDRAEGLFRPTAITLGGIALSAVLGIGFWQLGHRLSLTHAAAWIRWAAVVAYMLVIWAVIYATIRLARRSAGACDSGTAKLFGRRLLFAMGVYTVTLFAALLIWVEARPTATPAVILLALAPALPLIAVIALIGVYLRSEEDEFVRMVLNQSALLASGGVLAVATVWGFCEMFRVAPHAPIFLAFPLWFLLFAVAQPFVRLAYR